MCEERQYIVCTLKEFVVLVLLWGKESSKGCVSVNFWHQQQCEGQLLLLNWHVLSNAPDSSFRPLKPDWSIQLSHSVFIPQVITHWKE